VLLTQSRGAYLGLAAGTLVLVCLCARALWVVLPCAALGAVALGVAGVWPVLGKLAAGAFTVGLGWRATVWANALRVLNSAPFTGVGMGCFRLVTATLFPMAGAGSVDASHAHNLFLQVGIDLGIPGLMAYLASLGLSGYLLVRAYRAAGQRHDGALRALAAAGVASLVGICVHGLVDVAVWGNKGAFLPWVVMGLSAALYRASEQDAARL
jgi:putative inorganic carbon (HCO3(-)) transporter